MKRDEPKLCKGCPSFGRSTFQDLDSKELEILTDKKSTRSYKKGETLFRQGDVPVGLFCLQQGKVKIYKLGKRGQQQIVRLAKEGDLLGYRSLLVGEEYSATAETLENSRVCFLKKEDFFSVLSSNHKLAHRLIQLLCHDLRFAEDRLLDFVQKPARARVAETLLLLKKTYGLADSQGNTFVNITLNRKELAELSGIVLETAVRLLSEFKGKNWIRFEGKKLRVLNEQALEETANPIP